MNTTTLNELLERLRRRHVRLAALTSSGWTLLIALVLAIGIAWLDLVFDLPGGMRAVLGLGVIVGVILTAVTRFQALMQSGVPDQLAQRIDEVLGTRGQVRTAIDLMMHPLASEPLVVGMQTMAVNQAATLAHQVPADRVGPLKPPTAILSAGGAGIIALVLFGMLMPRLVHTQWLRFVTPFADVPPYTSLLLDVQPGNAEVIYDGSFAVSVATSGGAPLRVELVMKPTNGHDERVLPLFQEGPAQWRGAIAGVREPGVYFVRAERARSPQYDLSVITTPRWEDVQVKVTPPAYTNEQPYEGVLPADGIVGLPGTQVQLHVSSNRPLSKGVCRIGKDSNTTEVTLQPLAEDPKTVSGRFTLNHEGRLECQIYDVNAQPSSEPLACALTLLDDASPYVRMVAPPPVSFATPSAAIPVGVLAEDDYGVANVQLFRSLNHSRPLPMDFLLAQPPPRVANEASTLPLSAYGLKPGDEIRLFARAEDNNPNGPKGTESRIILLKIISEEAFQRALRTRHTMETLASKYQLATRHLENLKAEIQALLDELANQEGEITPQQREKLQRLSEQFQRATEEIESAANFELPIDMDQQLTAELQKLAEKMRSAAKAAQALAAKPPVGAKTLREQLEQLQAQCQGASNQYKEQVQKPLEALQAILPLKRAESQFIKLYEQQRDLAERLAALRGVTEPRDPATRRRMADLEVEQARLTEQLRELLNDIESAANQLPEDSSLDKLRNTSLQFVAAVRKSKAEDQMSSAAEELVALRGTPAHEAARTAAEILQRFIGQCQSMGGQAGQCPPTFAPRYSGSWQRSLSQMISQMSTGMGSTGSGVDGYSETRDTLQNVGLYGNLPFAVGAAMRADAEQNALAQAAANGEGALFDAGQSVDFSKLGFAGTRGFSEAAVPAEYRTRVADYFRQIADELGQP